MSHITRRISSWFRARRDERLKALIATTPRSGETLKIIDIGGSISYWRRVGIDFLINQKVRIDLVNLSDDEFYRSADDDQIFSCMIGDARATGLPDMSYDLCHSNSVIEHVGLWWDFESCANEIRRIAPVYYVQTPNFWFPVDPHFWRFPTIHWLPRPARIRLIQMLPLAFSGRAPDYRTACEFADDARLLNRAQMRCLFPEAELHAERFLLLAKSFIAIGRSANGAFAKGCHANKAHDLTQRSSWRGISPRTG